MDDIPVLPRRSADLIVVGYMAVASGARKRKIGMKLGETSISKSSEVEP